MNDLGVIMLQANGGSAFTIFFICVVAAMAYGIGCLGRKRKIGFGWAFVISLLVSPVIGLIVVLCSKKKDVDFVDIN